MMERGLRTLPLVLGAGLLVLLLGAPSSASGQDLVYEPTNPAFGGSGVNAQYLFQSANSQNPYDEEQDFGFRDDPLENFELQLQRQVLDQITRQILQDRFGEEGIDLTQEGTFDFERFTVDVTPGPSGITIQVFNRRTGESTTIEIPRF